MADTIINTFLDILDDPLFSDDPSDLDAMISSLPPLLPLCPNSDTGDSCASPSLLCVSSSFSAIQLIQILMSSAQSIHQMDTAAALSILQHALPILSDLPTSCSITKVASHFLHALSLRLLSPTFSPPPPNPSFYHAFYECTPYLKFAHFIANHAILDAICEHDHVHILDLGFLHGLQWPALIQALALRPGGPPSLRLTGIGPSSTDGRDNLHEVGARLTKLARSLGVQFSFRGLTANRLEHVQPWMLLQSTNRETVVVNSVFQLHRLLDGSGKVEKVLKWIRKLRPAIVTVVEQESDLNHDGFMDRFTEAMYYYSAMFDSLEGCGEGRQAAELYLQDEICNVVCCEGEKRIERHEPLKRWRERMGSAGFTLRQLGSNASEKASMLLNLYSREGFSVEEDDGCLKLGWHGRPLVAASTWRVAEEGHVAGSFGELAGCINDLL